jgi:membrane-bound lytic murein transglycosylase A
MKIPHDSFLIRSLAGGLLLMTLQPALAQEDLLPVPESLLETAASLAYIPEPVNCPQVEEIKPLARTDIRLPATLKPSRLESLPQWAQAITAESVTAFRLSCQKLENNPIWHRACNLMHTLPDDAPLLRWRYFFEGEFEPWSVVNGDGSNAGLITGYYEPLLTGALEKSGQHRYPLFGAPDDLVVVDLGEVAPDLKGRRLRGRLVGNRLVPYWSRADLENGHAPPNGKVLAWVDDAVDLFFLQIQGSGRIRLPDGNLLRVGYADQNGHPFRPIGRVVAEKSGMPISSMSLSTIRRWLSEHPEQLQAVLDSNPSFVFFHTLPNDERGPLGALGVPLTGGGSMAVDPRTIPLGAPVFLDTTEPSSKTPLRRVMMAQDTGGAIAGGVRADYFWGFGDAAGNRAGSMKQAGRMWLLYPKGMTPPDPR